MSKPLAGLYLHIPFCSRVCPYCDFAVRTGDAARRRRFADHLVAEIELHADHPLEFDTIYFGGGTPSLLETRDLERILESVSVRLHVTADCRTFLEANPENVTKASLADWKQLGVGTLSLGIQSFNADALKFLGRAHDPDDARRSVELALETGFDTVSIDLIYGLPDQTEDAWRSEMDAALSLGAHHVSCYQLTIHERTRFGLLHKRGQLRELPNNDQADLFRLTHRHLAEHGMQGYEVSQFASTPKHQSRHNLKYWNDVPYLGLGPSAHSFHRDRRWWNVPRTDPYEKCVAAGRRPIEGEEQLEPHERILETLMIGLRTYAGVDLARIRERWGAGLVDRNRALVAQFVESGLLRTEGERWVPTLDGLAVADGMARRFEIPRLDAW